MCTYIATVAGSYWADMISSSLLSFSHVSLWLPFLLPLLGLPLSHLCLSCPSLFLSLIPRSPCVLPIKSPMLACKATGMMERQRRGNNTLPSESDRVWRQDKASGWFCLAGVSGLSFLQCLDTVEHLIHSNLAPFVPRGSLPELTNEESGGDWLSQVHLEKMAVKMEMMVLAYLHSYALTGCLQLEILEISWNF